MNGVRSLRFKHERISMDKKALKTLAMGTALSAVLSVSAFAASIGGATVTATALNLRSQPSQSAPVVLSPQLGTSVVVGGTVGDQWYKVVYQGYTGYMSSEFLSFSETMDGDFGTGTVCGSDVRIRSGASLSSGIISVLQNGAQLRVLGVSGNWYKISGDGISGYIHSDYLSLNGGAASASPSGQTIVDTAMKYLGVPYVWGGTSANGFDCSGLVHFVYKECGYTINRTAASIYQNGVAVEKSQLQAGDAICFSSYSNSIGHVGIYIGDGQFIHASSSEGVVTIGDLNSSYYTKNYVGARRIV